MEYVLDYLSAHPEFMKNLISSNAIFCRKLDAESDFAYMLYKNNIDK